MRELYDHERQLFLEFLCMISPFLDIRQKSIFLHFNYMLQPYYILVKEKQFIILQQEAYIYLFELFQKIDSILAIFISAFWISTFF